MADFTRGSYGEILPPPLVSGLGPDEATAALIEASQHTKQQISSIPSKGDALRGHINQGLLYLHQQNLVRALAGSYQDADATELRQAVLRGEPLSLRPLGQEQLYFSSFAPVLQRIGDDRWQVGRPGQGRVLVFTASSPAEAIVQAQRTYVEWATDETEQFKAWAYQATAQVRPGYHHLIWLADLTTSNDLTAELADGFTLQRLGKHSTYRFITPKGWRIIEAGRPERAVIVAAAVLQQQQVGLPAYEPPDVLGALLALGVRLPQPAGDDRWRIGLLHGQVLAFDRVALQNGSGRYGLLLQPAQIQLVEPGKHQVIDHLAVEAGWSPEARLLVGLTWAGWKIGG